MALHPDAQKKAQAELDSVVGPGRMPDFSDWNSLVFVNAVIKETLRWHTIVPLSVPHATMADDDLHGYFIPAGTVLLPNIWSVPSVSCLKTPVLTFQSVAGPACMTQRYMKILMHSGRNVSSGMGNLIPLSGIHLPTSSALDEGSLGCGHITL